MSSYHHFYQKLDRLARAQLPSLKEIEAIGWEYLISPLELRLPKQILAQASAAISAFHNVSRRPAFAAQLEDPLGVGKKLPTNNAVLMAYDFHSDEAGNCYLVEINTNASGFMLSTLMNLAHEEGKLTDFVPLQLLKEAFLNEAKLSSVPLNRLAITDEDIQTQKMYTEFLMFRDWFNQLGWKAELVDAHLFSEKAGQLLTPANEPVDMVYNRLTDFYFENPAHQALAAAYGQGKVCISPHPAEYWRLADKQRLIQFSQPEFLKKIQASDTEVEAISKVMLPSFEKSDFESQEKLWEQRKNLFFKPKRSYGGKSVYRGESVSRKVFDRLMTEEILVQRFQSAQRVSTDDPRSVLTNWKFDLRFYAYADQIQMVVARIYQGQVTNFSSPLGGFTKVLFV